MSMIPIEKTTSLLLRRTFHLNLLEFPDLGGQYASIFACICKVRLQWTSRTSRREERVRASDLGLSENQASRAQAD